MSVILVACLSSFAELEVTGGTGVPSRIASLDGLRGCAVVMVMLYHFTAPFSDTADFATRGALRLLSFGWTGVDVFFVLSGFLITGILTDAKGAKGYFRTFYMRRALRIVPLYYAALAAIFVVPQFLSSPVAQRLKIPFSDQAWFWLYLQNFHRLRGLSGQFTGHLWSLAIEEQFYLVWPIAILLLSRRRAFQLCGGLAVLALAMRIPWLFVMPGPGRSVFWATPTRLDGLVVGAAIALMPRGTRGLQPARRIAIPVALVALAVIGFVYADSGYFAIANPILRSFGLTAIAMLYGSLLVVAVLRPPRLISAVLESKPLAFFGQYSYGMYVIHVPLLIVLGSSGVTGARFESFIGNSLLALIAYTTTLLAATVVSALLTWHLFEKRFLSLKRHFIVDSTSRKEQAVQIPVAQ